MLGNPVVRALAIALIYILFALVARMTALILLSYWDHFIQVLYFNSKF
jgi:hypothetical protein